MLLKALLGRLRAQPALRTSMRELHRVRRRLNTNFRCTRSLTTKDEIMPESKKRGKLHPVSFQAFVKEMHQDPKLKAEKIKELQSLGFRAFAEKHYDLITRQKRRSSTQSRTRTARSWLLMPS
jgi:hypothetical protein